MRKKVQFCNLDDLPFGSFLDARTEQNHYHRIVKCASQERPYYELAVVIEGINWLLPNKKGKERVTFSVGRLDGGAGRIEVGKSFNVVVTHGANTIKLATGVVRELEIVESMEAVRKLWKKIMGNMV